MAASEDKLGALHDAVATTLAEMLKGTELPEEEDEEGNILPAKVIPPSAATITAAIQFLKNNSITCTPSQDNALGELKEAAERRAKERAARSKATKTDLASAEETMGFMGRA